MSNRFVCLLGNRFHYELVYLYPGASLFPDEPQEVFAPASPEKSHFLLLDISRAYFNSVTPEDEPTHVELLPEFGAPMAEQQAAGRASTPAL